MRYYGNDGRTYQLGSELKSGGEGIVYEVDGAESIVAKIYKDRKLSRDEKVAALSNLPWPESVREYLVLPRVALYEEPERKVLRGFIMDRVTADNTLADVYSETHPLSIYKKACVAKSLCEAVIAVHSVGNLVIGDFNSKNILVDRTSGDIKLIDTDSIHLTVKRNGRDVVLPCEALDPMLFMPEILRKFKSQNVRKLIEINDGTFDIYTDYYCLAYHIHLLLMAQKPFGAAMDKNDIDNSVPAPTAKSMACEGQYAYVNLPARTSLPKFYPDFNIITPELQQLFIRSFKDGASDPRMRASALEFRDALNNYIAGLRHVRCKGFDHYLYYKYKCRECEWCRVEAAKNQKRKFEADDLFWMSDEELLYFSKSVPDKKVYAFLELGARYSDISKPGISHELNKFKAKSYLKKCLRESKSVEDPYVEPLANKILNALKER